MFHFHDLDSVCARLIYLLLLIVGLYNKLNGILMNQDLRTNLFFMGGESEMP